MMKIEKLDEQSQNLYVESEANFKMGNAKFNVIHSSEISKVLRELTQCIANDRDIFSHNSKLLTMSDKRLNKENEEESLRHTQLYTSNSIVITEPNSSSTSTSTITDLFTTAPSISIVMDKHTCLQCGKQFNKRDFLQKHKIVHEIPRHKCIACEKSFVREDKLKRHFTSIHSKHRPHICDVCSKAFARKDKLKDHQKHHLTAGNSFQCTECHVPFVQKSDLNRHYRGVHKGEVGIGLNIPSRRFVKSRINEEIPGPQNDQTTQISDTTQKASTKPMLISNSFYPLQTSILPLSSSNSTHVNQLNPISDLSTNLVKPNISFIPAIPLKVELNYTTPATLPQIINESNKSNNHNNNSVDKEECQTNFKSKKSSKSKLKVHSNTKTDESTINKLGNPLAFPFSNCKTESSSTPASAINCLVSQGTSLYPHIPIMTPFQSPMISVFPTNSEFYSNNLSSSTKPTNENNLIFNSSAVIHGFKPPVSLDNLVSTQSSLSSSISNNYPTKPINSLSTNNFTFAHQNLYQFQQNQLRYYSYFQPGSHFFGQHSTRPLATNIYPYMPF